MEKSQKPAAPKAYSYLRFSTPEQARGDSFRRQTMMAEEYAARNGLALDDTLSLQDLGVSAYHGNNSERGMLGYFREAIGSGEVPKGSVLLVESLDRISRQSPRRALRVLEDIVEQGVSVVTLIDGRVYTQENLDSDPFGLMASIMMFMRAHEESATKSRRLKEAWGAKRARAGERALTAIMPAWLQLDRNTKQARLIPERRQVIEQIFNDTLNGHGQHSIANRLNEAGVKPWGRGKYWQRSYIAKILDNEAVIGAATLHTLDRVDGKRVRTPHETISDYYPPAISLELWKEVKAFAVGKRARTRGRHSNAPVTNMLAGLAACPLCDGTMTRVTKGKRSAPKYVCARSKTRAGCTYRSVNVAEVAGAIIERLPARLRDVPAGERDPLLDRQIEDASGAMDAVRQKIDRLIAAIEDGQEGVAIGARMGTLEGEYSTLRANLERLETLRAAVTGRTVHARIERLLAALEPETGAPDPAAINLALQSVFKRVVIDYPEGLLNFEWIHAGTVELPYALPDGID